MHGQQIIKICTGLGWVRWPKPGKGENLLGRIRNVKFERRDLYHSIKCSGQWKNVNGSCELKSVTCFSVLPKVYTTLHSISQYSLHFKIVTKHDASKRSEKVTMIASVTDWGRCYCKPEGSCLQIDSSSLGLHVIASKSALSSRTNQLQ